MNHSYIGYHSIDTI